MVSVIHTGTDDLIIGSAGPDFDRQPMIIGYAMKLFNSDSARCSVEL